MTLGDAIREYRLEHRMSQRQFAEKCGLSNGYIAMVERGVNPATGKPIVPSIEKCKAIANAMGLTLDAMLRTIDNTEVLVNDFGSGYTDMEKLPRNVKPITQLRRQRIPLIGKVAAGEPIYSPEDYDAYVDSPVKCDAAVGVQGDSMVPKFEDGDTVYVRCQSDVGDGQIAVVFLDDDAVIKRVYLSRGAINAVFPGLFGRDVTNLLPTRAKENRPGELPGRSLCLFFFLVGRLAAAVLDIFVDIDLPIDRRLDLGDVHVKTGHPQLVLDPLQLFMPRAGPIHLLSGKHQRADQHLDGHLLLVGRACLDPRDQPVGDQRCQQRDNSLENWRQIDHDSSSLSRSWERNFPSAFNRS